MKDIKEMYEKYLIPLYCSIIQIKDDENIKVKKDFLEL